jgi:hypothetical protein
MAALDNSCDVGTGGGGGSGGGGGGTCLECACTSKVAQGGCADICDGNLSGGGPNFCNGKPALSQCEQCIVSFCGVATPDDCH